MKRDLRIKQMGPDFLLIETSASHPPGPATIVLAVDDCVYRWNVWLPSGVSAESERVSVALVPESEKMIS